MSGSGSTIFGIFGRKPVDIEKTFPNTFTYVCRLLDRLMVDITF